MRNLFWLFAFLSTTAFAGGITDRPGLFSSDATSRALATIQSIAATAHEDINIDVYNEAPSTAFASWANEHAPDTNGVYVVISRNPGHLEVAIRNSAHYSSSDRQQMANLLLDGFKRRNFDGGLDSMLRYASKQVAAVPVTSAVVDVPVARTVTPKITAKPHVPEEDSGVSFLWWLILIPLVSYGVYKMWQSLSVSMPGDNPPPPSKEKITTPRRSAATPPPETPSWSATPIPPPPAAAAPRQEPSFAAGIATGVVLDELISSTESRRRGDDALAAARRRDEETASRRREEEAAARRRRERDEEDSRRSSSYDSGSSGSSFDSGSSGSSFDSGSSGGGFDSGSSGGGFDSGGGGSSGGDF